MSDHDEGGERRIVAAGAVVLAVALCTTGYFVFRLATGDASEGAAPGSPVESAQTVPSQSPSESSTPSGAEPRVEPAHPADEAEPPEPARVAGARAPASDRTEVEQRPDEPTATTAMPAVEPAPTAEPSASASASASAVSVPSAAPPAASSVANKSAPAEVAPTIVGEFVNKVGPEFRLLGVECVLDGKSVYSGPGGRAVELFRRPSGPGKHSVSVVARYQGNGSGVFSYFEGYRFTVKGGREFSTNAHGPTRITITGVERGGKTVAFEDRLGVTVNVK
jgi:hypothetical protein